MSPTSDSVSITKLYKLKEDGSNWAVYRDRTSDYLKSKGLRSHLNRRVTKPIEVIEVWDDELSKTIFYKPDDPKHENPIALTNVLKYEELASKYDRLEGIGSDVLNNTIPASIYREIHHLNSLARKWKALSLMFEHRGNVVQIDILTKLQAARYTSGSMRAFLSQLMEWRNDLLDISPHLSLRNDYHCTICDMDGHLKERCFAEGGGRHDQALEWYKKKQAERLANEGKNANNAWTSTTTSKTSYSCAVQCLPTIDTNSIALSATTNDYQGVILDCGASDHFTLHRSLLTNYVEIQEHTGVADNRTTFVAGKETMVVELPMGEGKPPTKLTLTNVFCVPSFVFTLISTTRMDSAGYTILQKGGKSTVIAPDGVVIGEVPLIRGLYRVTDPAGSKDSTPLWANATTMSLMDFHIVMGHRSFGDLRNRGGEYLGAEFTSHLEHSGTVRKLTTHGSPQSNGIAERAMGVHVSTARALLIQSGLPTRLWAEAICFSVWLHNRQITTAVPTLKTPFKISTGKRPNLANLQPWGSKVHVKDLNAGKLESRIREGRYLGPDEESLGIPVYWPDKRTVTVERQVFYNLPEARKVVVEGEKDDEDHIYVFNNDTSVNRHPVLHFPQEDNDQPGEYPDSRPASPSIPPSNQPPIATEEDEEDDMPGLNELSDSEDEDGLEDEEEDDFFDDKKVEKDLLGEEGGEGTTDYPIINEPLQRASAEPIPPTEPSTSTRLTATCTLRNAAQPPGFYKQTRTYNRRDTTTTNTGLSEAQLASLVASWTRLWVRRV
ncbi:hypothetical protein MD484_g9032, partial [Candolleomyces efflorescens]